jgi:hypothetical protein
MQPGMVYDYPLWVTALMLIGAAMVAAAVIELAVRRVVPAELRRQHNDVAAASALPGSALLPVRRAGFRTRSGPPKAGPCDAIVRHDEGH